MLSGELADRVKDVLFNVLGVAFGRFLVIGDDGRREVGAVDGVVNGEGYLVAGASIDDCSSDTRPHRLYGCASVLVMGAVRSMWSAYGEVREVGDIRPRRRDDAREAATDGSRRL